MRAHKPTAKGKADAVSRARMLMKSRLWWLGGFADSAGWTALPLDGSREPETLSLERAHLRRATLAIGELERDFPRALPRIVGDGARWAEAARQVVALVKPWVHGGGRPPPDVLDSELWPRAAREQARALMRECPPLEPLVGALSWLLATRAALAPRHVRYLARNRERMARIVEPGGRDRIVTALRLVHLGATLGEDLVAPLVALAGDARLASAPLSDGGAAEKAIAAIEPDQCRIDSLPVAPTESAWPGEIADWTSWLIAADGRAQRRFLRLLGACALEQPIAAWSEWWRELGKLLARARRFQSGRPPRTPDALKALERAFERRLGRRPQQIDAGSLGRALRLLIAADPCIAPAHAVLARIPAEQGMRVAFAVQWSRRVADAGEVKSMARWLTHLRDYLATTGAAEAALRPLADDARSESRGRAYGCVVDKLADRPPDHAPRFFAALAALQARRPDASTRPVALRIADLVRLAFEPETIALLAAALHDGRIADSWVPDEVARAGHALCADQPDAFAALVVALRELFQDHPGLAPDRLVESLRPSFADDIGLLRELVLSGDRSALVACGHKLAALRAMGQPLPEVAVRAEAGWIDDLPARLHPSLHLLARSCPEAEAIARRAIGSVWRSRASLELERATVVKQLARAPGDRRGRLEARKASLSRQIRNPTPPPERELRRLDDKLRRRAALERLRALDAAVGARLEVAAARHHGLTGDAGWLIEPRTISLLAAFAALPARERHLARELVRVRGGPPPWDLRDHAANRAFLARLESLGIDPAPWLEGIGSVEHDTPGGRVSLALEDDPLEVFHMGGHFRTCLSPGAQNFFSVLANAADINKRVLYARGGGAVVGRRLLCLDRDGAIVAFNAYCHQPSIGFDHLSAEFARELAARMGTRLDSRGQVPTLVASRWYDDGPDDLSGQLAFLDDDSAFRKRLAEIAPEELPALVTAELRTGTVDAQMATLMAGLPELVGRPELVHALVPMIADRARLPGVTVLRLATLLESAGAAERATELFGDALERTARFEFRVQGWAEMRGIELLCRIAPGRGLRALRQTRPDRARSWNEEKHADRLLAAAGALERLRRPAQAAALLRHAAAASGPPHAVDAARERLRAVA